MKTLLLITACVLSTLAPLQARIGDTLEQCKARYGEIKRTDGNRHFFRKGGMYIAADLINGKVEWVYFMKVTKESFSENEMEILMKANGGDNAWKKTKEISINESWETEDLSMKAIHSSIQDWFAVATAKWINSNHQEAKAKENESLEGF